MPLIGDKIRQLREQLGMTQEALGAKCGTTKQTIFKYETGIVTNIPMDKLEVIAKALDVSPAFLMGWNDSSAPDETTQMMRDPDMKELFSIASKASPEERRQFLKIAKAIIGED